MIGTNSEFFKRVQTGGNRLTGAISYDILFVIFRAEREGEADAWRTVVSGAGRAVSLVSLGAVFRAG